MKEVLLVILCYFIGAIPFSYILSAILGKVDIRSQGSGNVGATNVLRTVGVKVALLSFLGDLGKGALCALIGLYFGGELLAAFCALAAVIGHCYTVFLRFRGGKGVATTGGVILVLMPSVFLILLTTFIVVAVFTRYVSLASICVAAMFPIAALIMGESLSYVIMSLCAAIIVIYGHRENISRFRNGTESRITDKVSKDLQ
ncbi:MAG: glycerol-3-phosphate 1-O-acyltransferase PlsY [Bacillota bacterium]|nr:glycerol-3-phosphate 1-O-acyltransferase PlsY [Bacillota bacterium]